MPQASSEEEEEERLQNAPQGGQGWQADAKGGQGREEFAKIQFKEAETRKGEQEEKKQEGKGEKREKKRKGREGERRKAKI